MNLSFFFVLVGCFVDLDLDFPFDFDALALPPFFALFHF
jgi:hypothetical protein